MKKFVFLYEGVGTGAGDEMDTWMAWFGKIGPYLTDGGNPFAEGRKVSTSGSSVTINEAVPITGYSIVNAEDFDAAIALLDGCPSTEGVRVYEALPM
jgi:hypothetical protein